MKQNIYIATNNGDMGGGEVMLLNIARALRSLGHKVTVLGPAYPEELLEAAQDEGFSIVRLPARNRREYMVQLRLWDRKERKGLLWCNGLVPSLATAGHKNRIVHLHQTPEGLQQYAFTLAKQRALTVLVPSKFMTSKVPGSVALNNWVSEIAVGGSRRAPGENIRVGFLGRLSVDKGTHVLAEAIDLLNKQREEKYKLVIGGEPRFVAEDSKEKVLSALDKLGSNVEMMGWVEPGNFFGAIDLLVVPSIWEEPFGLVLAEAMSAKIPVIISRSGALPEILGEGYPWAVDPQDAEMLSHRIAEVADCLRSQDPALEENLVKNYWRWQENYSPEAGKHAVAQILEAVLPRA